MVRFCTSRDSFDRLFASADLPPTALWVAAGVLEPSELATLRASGLAVTAFDRTIDPLDPSAMEDAIDTIREHHSGEDVRMDGSFVR